MIEGGLRCCGNYKTDSENNPLISYITVVFNRVSTIEACIKSVLKQTGANVEYIVVDGASTDGTLDIIQKYSDKIDYYISEEDTGIYNAMNKGVGLARGRLICFMNSDDTCLSGAAKTVTSYYLKKHPDIICGGRILRQKGTDLNELLFQRFAVSHSCFRYIQMFHQSTYASRNLFEKVGLFKEKFSLIADWVWESEAIDSGASVLFINEKLCIFNYDGASSNGFVQRDSEWVNWIKESFPFLLKADAAFFLNCLDRDRHPMISLKTVRRVAGRYKTDQVFLKAIYETSIMLVLECFDSLPGKLKSVHTDVEKLWASFIESHETDCISANEARKKIVILMNDSLNGKCCDYSLFNNPNYDFLDLVRCFEINTILESVKLKHLRRKSRNNFTLLIKKDFYFIGYIAGKSILLSRLFYIAVRNRYLVKIAKKRLNRKLWNKI